MIRPVIAVDSTSSDCALSRYLTEVIDCAQRLARCGISWYLDGEPSASARPPVKACWTRGPADYLERVVHAAAGIRPDSIRRGIDLLGCITSGARSEQHTYAGSTPRHR